MWLPHLFKSQATWLELPRVYDGSVLLVGGPEVVSPPQQEVSTRHWVPGSRSRIRSRSRNRSRRRAGEEQKQELLEQEYKQEKENEKDLVT